VNSGSGNRPLVVVLRTASIYRNVLPTFVITWQYRHMHYEVVVVVVGVVVVVVVNLGVDAVQR